MKSLYFKYFLIILILPPIQAQEVCDLSFSEIDSLITIATEARRKHDIIKSITISDSIIKISHQLSEDQMIYAKTEAYNNIGINNLNLKNLDEALVNFRKALEYSKRMDHDSLVIRLLNNLGNIYSHELKDDEIALAYYNEALRKAKKANDSSGIALLSLNIGFDLFKKNKHDQGILYIRPFATNPDNITDPHMKSYAFRLMGLYYTEKALYAKSEQYLKKALAFDERTSSLIGMYKNYKSYAFVLSKMKKHEEANAFLLKADTTRDTIVEQESKAQKKATLAKFQLEEYQRNLSQLQNKNIEVTQKAIKRKKFNYINITVSAVLILLLGTLLYFYQAITRVKKQLQQQNIALEAQKNRAENLTKTKSQFISTVSHELRTPLYGVIGLTSLLLDSHHLQKNDLEYVKSLKFSSDYLLHLINDVLEISKIDSKKIELESTPFNIKKLLQNLINPFEADASEKGNKIHLQIGDNIPQLLKSDTVRLSQILINLIGNAVKFTNNGDIWVRLSLLNKTKSKAKILFEIEDNGLGIPKEQHQKIFESFAQLGRYENNSTFKGTGLGLAIVSRLVKLFNSKINLDSELGKGTIFSFELELETTSKTLVEEDEHEKFLFGDYKILVAEDNRISQIVTQKILEKENLKCDLVTNGRDAIKAMKNKQYDLILMDLHMPVMDGIDTTVAIRQFNSKIPIIILTASDIEDIDQDIISKGANDIITKPFDNYLLYQKIHRYCAKTIQHN